MDQAAAPERKASGWQPNEQDQANAKALAEPSDEGAMKGHRSVRNRKHIRFP
jgi:hypothetical protein